MPRMMRLQASLLLSSCLLAASATSGFPPLPQTQDLRGEVLGENNNPIAGAACTLTATSPQVQLPEQGLSVTTEEKGQFDFPGLLPGTYALTCAAVGYQPVFKGGLEVAASQAPFVQIVLPSEIVVKQRIEVTETAPTVAQQQNTTPPATINSQQLQTLPLIQQKFKAALPLVPGVVRTPDGKINIKGTSESQGLVLVDAAESVDPVTGAYTIDLPIDAIESLEVFKSAYQTQFGRFSGGLTLIQTKAPSNEWRYEFNDLLPTARFEAGHLQGIQDDGPRVTFTGPIIPNRLDFIESAIYYLSKQPVRGLAWPNNITKTESVNSFTSFQYIFTPQHLFTVNVNVFPVKKQFVDINSLVPQTASSDYGQRGFSVQAIDRVMFASGGILSTFMQSTKFDSNAHGQGPLDMLVTPNGWGGNFFNTYTRTSDEQQVRQMYELPQRQWLGKHELKLGAEYVRRAYSGTSDSRPVELQRADGTLAEQIDFSGPGSLAVEDNEVGLFFQDHWIFSDQLALDAGLRFSTQTIGEPEDFAPRFGLVYSPGADGKTILRGGIGVFDDRVPLLAADFTQNPLRTISMFDEQGNPVGAPVTYFNAYLKYNEQGQSFTPTRNRLDSTPYNLTWTLEADREIRPHVLARLSYLSSRTFNEFIINPLPNTFRHPVFLLSNQGASRYHEFESTLRIQPNEKVNVNASYVYSLARGDLNTIGQIYVPFEQPVIRSDAVASLPSNVPNRFITWAQFKVPWKVTIAPLFDIHSGFPYSAYDVLQNYVGVPNSQRFPTFFSTDLKVTKDFRISFLPWVRNHILRGAFAVYNVTDHSNPRDVYSDIASPYFGHFAGLQHRSLETWFDIVY